MIYSTGLFAADDNNSKLNDFLETENRAGYTVDDVYNKCSFDMAMYEQAFIEVIYNREGKIAELYHKSPHEIRIEAPDEYGAVNNYYYSNTWGEIKNKRDKRKANDVESAIKIPAFNPKEIGEGRQLLHIKRYDSTNEYYPVPSYVSASNFIELEYILSDYVVNKVSGGYYPSGVFYVNSSMSEEDQNRFIQEFRSKHEGVNNAGRIIFVFGDTAIQKPEFVKLTDDLGNSVFKEYIETSQLQIATAHNGSLSLLGIDLAGQLGNTNADSSRINVARLYFISTTIAPFQNLLLKGFNKIFKVNEMGKATVVNENLKLQQPIVQYDTLTEDETRELAYGLPPKANNNITPDPIS